MAESITSGYKLLFEVRLLHHYWLDEGATIFDLIPDQARKDARLLQYDVRSFLSVAPTAATLEALKGLRGVVKNTALGFLGAVPDNVVVPLDLVFEFVVTVRNASFLNYTSRTLEPQKVSEFYYPPEDQTYRYRSNVPVLSNTAGASRTLGGQKALFLSKEIPAITPGDKVEALVLSGNDLLQLTEDQPNAGTVSIHTPATEIPIFVHQGDVPPIVPPSGLVGAPERGILLSGDTPDTVFALIRLSAVRGDDPDFSCVDGNGVPKTAHPVLQCRFKNRLTIWRYINKHNNQVTSEPTPLPLTYFGNAGTKQKPTAADLVKVEKTGSKITQLVSEIFV
jgi:hypothetical protein